MRRVDPSYLRFGTIDEKDYAEAIAKATARVFLKDKSPGILTKPLPILNLFARADRAYIMPKEGDRVAILLDENAVDGVILGSLYTKQDEPPATTSDKHIVQFEDGTFIQYDKSERKFLLEVTETTDAIELRGSGVIKILAKGSDIQIVIESEGKLAIAAKEDINIISDKNINLDALGTVNQIDMTTPNPRAPYFPDRADDWFGE